VIATLANCNHLQWLKLPRGLEAQHLLQFTTDVLPHLTALQHLELPGALNPAQWLSTFADKCPPTLIYLSLEDLEAQNRGSQIGYSLDGAVEEEHAPNCKQSFQKLTFCL